MTFKYAETDIFDIQQIISKAFSSRYAPLPLTYILHLYHFVYLLADLYQPLTVTEN